MKSIITMLIFGVFLVGCKQLGTQPTQKLNLVDLADVDQYQVLGKMSFSDGRDGGSGRVDWQFKGGFITAELKAPLGSKSWQIEEYDGGAKISTSEGYTGFSETAQALVSQELGWMVPWNELKSWIKGTPDVPEDARIIVHSDGYDIHEKGWVIQYSKLRNFDNNELPTKIIARKENYSIKVSIKKWNW